MWYVVVETSQRSHGHKQIQTELWQIYHQLDSDSVQIFIMCGRFSLRLAVRMFIVFPHGHILDLFT